MNKAKLIEVLTEKINVDLKSTAKLSKKQIGATLDGLLNLIIEELKAGREVSLSGFGVFTSFARHARGGVNPRNPKERIVIPAVKVAKFRTGQRLKEALK